MVTSATRAADLLRSLETWRGQSLQVGAPGRVDGQEASVTPEFQIEKDAHLSTLVHVWF